MLTAGVDVGSLSADAAIMSDNEIVAWSVVPTGPDSAETAHKAMDEALKQTDLSLEDIQFIVSTGYGRVVVPFSQKVVTEISCHAKGAHWFFPDARTVLDMGGQDCKAIRVDERGKVKNFAMNDKCAAGTGRYMEVMADLLDVPLAGMGELSLQNENTPPAISNVCVVFAKSEVLSLARKGTPKSDILAGLCEAVADRVKALVSIVGVEETFVITGGIAKNIGVVRRVEDRVGMKAKICFEPQIVGAVGGALFARDALEKQLAKA